MSRYGWSVAIAALLVGVAVYGSSDAGDPDLSRPPENDVEQSSDDPLKVVLADFSVTSATPREFARILSMQSQIGISIEESRTPPPPFTLEGFEGSAEQILNLYVATTTSYAWSFDSSAGMVNLHPTRGSPLGDEVSCPSVESVSLEHMLVSGDALGLSQRGVDFQLGRGRNDWIQQTISLTGVTRRLLREILNDIVDQLDFPGRWELIWLGSPSGEGRYGVLVVGIGHRN